MIKGAVVIDSEVFPERIGVGYSRVGISSTSTANWLKAGLCGWPMTYMTYMFEDTRLPRLINVLAQFFSKPKKQCFKKWLHYCWLEFKECAMITSGRIEYVPDHLWLMRTVDSKTLMYYDETELDSAVERGQIQKDQFTRYDFNNDQNCYMKAIPPKPLDYADMLLMATSMFGCSC